MDFYKLDSYYLSYVHWKKNKDFAPNCLTNLTLLLGVGLQWYFGWYLVCTKTGLNRIEYKKKGEARNTTT